MDASGDDVSTNSQTSTAETNSYAERKAAVLAKIEEARAAALKVWDEPGN